MTPLAADRIRKGCAYALAIALTLLTFRVLGRASTGRQSLLDVELWAAVALAALGVVWVRAARRVRAAPAAGTGADAEPSREAGAPPPREPGQ